MRNILNTFLSPARPLGQSRPARWGRALLAVGLLGLAPLAGRAQTALGTISANQTLGPGTYTFSLAANQTARLEGWGGGGASARGNGSTAGGGGGGAYAITVLTGPATYTAQVGTGGTYSPAAAAGFTRVVSGTTTLLQAQAGSNASGTTGASGGMATASTPQGTAQAGDDGGNGQFHHRDQPEPPTPPIRVVILTTSVHPSDLERLEELPHIALLNKPLTREKINRILQEYFQRQLPAG